MTSNNCGLNLQTGNCEFSKTSVRSPFCNQVSNRCQAFHRVSNSILRKYFIKDVQISICFTILLNQPLTIETITSHLKPEIREQVKFRNMLKGFKQQCLQTYKALRQKIMLEIFKDPYGHLRELHSSHVDDIQEHVKIRIALGISSQTIITLKNIIRMKAQLKELEHNTTRVKTIATELKSDLNGPQFKEVNACLCVAKDMKKISDDLNNLRTTRESQIRSPLRDKFMCILNKVFKQERVKKPAILVYETSEDESISSCISDEEYKSVKRKPSPKKYHGNKLRRVYDQKNNIKKKVRQAKLNEFLRKNPTFKVYEPSKDWLRKLHTSSSSSMPISKRMQNLRRTRFIVDDTPPGLWDISFSQCEKDLKQKN